jgi:hypothetical protein
MLDPWIIEEIRRREEERKREEERVELPLESPHYREREKKPPAEAPERGVTIIDI